jgi:transcription initiation factor TFIIB
VISLLKDSKINLTEEVIDKEITAGKQPNAMVATVLYLSSLRNNERITQKDIATASGVTEVTIRNRFKDLKNHIDE